MTKILFIEAPEDFGNLILSPEYLTPPLWALALGSYLKEKIPDVKIKVADGKYLSLSAIKRKIIEFEPDFVGFSPNLQNYLNTLKVARFCKRLGINVIFGGINASNLKKEILKNRGKYSDDYCVDAIVQGDGEKALHEYISGKPLSKINNLVFVDKNGEIKENPVAYLDLDSLPIPDRDIVRINNYFKRNWAKILTIYSQKGCRWRMVSREECIYCAFRDPFVRLRNPKRVWEEIKYLKEKYGVEILWDATDDFLNDSEWVENFYQESFSVARKPKLTVYLRADEVTEKTAKILKAINVYRVGLGLESGCPQTLVTLKKGTTVKQNERAPEILHKYGIKTHHYFMIGAPGETMESALQTIKFAKKIAQNKNVLATQVVKLRPYPGSPAWRMLLEKTGDKYRDRDIVYTLDVIEDWLKIFTKLTLKDLKILSKKVRSFSLRDGLHFESVKR